MDKEEVHGGDLPRPSGRATPTGVAPVFSRTALFRRESGGRLLNLFALWGYREIMLPAFEYLDSIAPGLDPLLLPTLYIMQDRGSGQILVLRPDATAQIARLTTQAFQDRLLPLRFSYSTSVFRDEHHAIFRARERHQTGLELLGDRSSVADFEILELCLKGADAFPLQNPVLVLSHAGIQDLVLSAAAGNSGGNRELRDAFFSRNVARFRDARGGAPSGPAIELAARLASGVLSLPEARDLLAALASIAGESGREILAAFSDLLRLLSDSPRASSILLDLALPPPGPYYTGMFFELFTADAPTHLASGGRYDRLGLAFGHDLPAVGFAFHLDSIEEALRKQEPDGEKGAILATYGPGQYAAVKLLSDTLRERSQPVFMASAEFPDIGQGLAYADRILSEHEEIRGVVLFDAPGGRWLFRQRSGESLDDATSGSLARRILLAGAG